MPLAGFKPTIPVFKRAKTFHALDRAATVTGRRTIYTQLIQLLIYEPSSNSNKIFILIVILCMLFR
jgi:hypothetical protein